VTGTARSCRLAFRVRRVGRAAGRREGQLDRADHQRGIVVEVVRFLRPAHVGRDPFRVDGVDHDLVNRSRARARASVRAFSAALVIR